MTAPDGPSQPRPSALMSGYTVRLEDVGKDDVQRCGGKGANLGELTRAGVRIPPGFCVTAGALPYLVEANSLSAAIAEIAGRLDFEDLNAVEAETARIRDLIASATIPADLEAEIRERYRALVSDENTYVAVR